MFLGFFLLGIFNQDMFEARLFKKTLTSLHNLKTAEPSKIPITTDAQISDLSPGLGWQEAILA